MKTRTTLMSLLAVCLMLVACDTKTRAMDSCGDGFIDPGEEYDQILGEATCGSLEHYNVNGHLACNSNCTFDLSDCGGMCGDGVIDVPFSEECEGDDLADFTCSDLGLGSGTLACKTSCRYETAGCELATVCGDGFFASPFEKCEEDNLDNETCLSLGYYGGDLACSADCRSFDESDCLAAGRCGDVIVQTASGEDCDGSDLNEQTCASMVPTSPYGLLTCGDDCHFVTTGCRADFITLIDVPGGTFQRDETVTNLSVVSAFRMSDTEITRWLFSTVMGTDPTDVAYSSGTGDPVWALSWYDAIAFCNKLSLLEGLTPVYAVSGVDFNSLTYAWIPTDDDATWNAATANWSANGYRLPTEMEWMWAAMGADTANPGTVNATGYLKAFAGSTGTNVIRDCAWYLDNSAHMTHPAGTKLPNELGFYDMSGNVWEWAWDWHDWEYPSGTVTDYRGPASGNNRVFRGGSMSAPASNCTVALRNYVIPSNRDYNIGFRVVRP